MLRTRTWIFLLLTLILQAAITFVLLKLPVPSDIFRIQSSFSLQSFQQVVDGWSPADRAVFLMHYTFDFIYPWAYGLLFYFLLEEIPGLARFRFLPLLAGLSDELENTLHFMLVNGNISMQPAPIFAAGLFSIIKWLLLALLPVLVIAHLGKRLEQRP